MAGRRRCDRQLILSQSARQAPWNDCANLPALVAQAHAYTPVGHVLADAEFDSESNDSFVRQQIHALSIIPAKRGKKTWTIHSVRPQMRHDFSNQECRSRMGSPSLPRSATTRRGLLRGCPRPARGTRIDSQGGLGHAMLRRFSRRHVHAQRRAVPLHDQNQLHSFAPYGFAHCVAPLLACRKLASRKASSQSIWPRRSNWRSSWRQAFSQMPSSCQWRNRRQQVTPLGYCTGMSRQRAFAKAGEIARHGDLSHIQSHLR
jgi:hypothetical protein